MLSVEQINKYFESNINWKVVGGFGIFAVLLIISSFSEDGSFWLFAIGFLIIVGIIVYIKDALNAISDKELDKAMRELADKRIAESYDKLGITSDDVVTEPLCIFGVEECEGLQSRAGDDDIVRYNPQILTIIHFGKNQILTNTASMNLKEPNKNIGDTNEFFYKDITSVSVYEAEKVKRFAINVHGSKECDMAISGNLESVNEAVNTIRKILREKKAES